jgi:O-antigen ligase
MKKLEIAALVLLGLLFFVWPMPHTVSVRDLLLVLNLCLFGYLAWQRGWPRQSFRKLLLPASALAALTAWMYLVAFFISPETSWSLDEISSQWIRALLALLAGVVVAIAVKKESGLVQKTLFVIFVALMLHVLYVDLEALNIWLHDQNLERLAGLTEGPDKSNYLTNLLFCFLLTESFSRIFHKKGMLPFGNGVLTAALVLAVISVIVERTRNGIIMLVLMLLALGALYLVEQRKRLKKTAIIGGIATMFMVVIAGLGLVVAARQSSSLNNLVATVSIGWDTENSKAWQNDGRDGWPKLPSGETVDSSAYLRIAWLKEGLILFKEHPYGIGFGRNAFGHGLKAKYGKGGGHSHSGLLDFAIGTGVPGTLLWLGFFVSLMRLAWKRSRAAHSPVAILLMLLLLDFGARVFLDSVIRDHMLQQFMLLVGFASVIMMSGTQGKERSSA